MAAVPELPYEPQQHEIRQRANFKCSNGWGPVQYLSPNFLTRFPLAMSSAEMFEGLSWNDMGGLFRHRDAVPVTFIDEDRLVEEVRLNVFDKKTPTDFAERRSLALFKLATEEGLFYGLTVVYLPSRQQRLTMALALEAVFKTEGNAVALAGMPKDRSDCAYMPEPSNGEHYTLLPVSGDAAVTHGPVGDFAAAQLAKGSVHLQIGSQTEVKLPGSFTHDSGSSGLVDEDVYQRGPIWENKNLVERNEDNTPVIRNGRTIAIEREVGVAGIDVYTDTNVHKPLTLVACPPKYSPDDDEFTESVSEMEARILGQIEEERKAQWEGRVGRGKPQGGETDVMDTTTAAGDPSAIPGTNLHVVPPEGSTMEHFPQVGQPVVDLTGAPDDVAAAANQGLPAAQPPDATGGRGVQISDEELANQLTLFQCLDAMNRDLFILEDGYFKCVDAVRKVVKQISADLDALEDAYVKSVMASLAKWQATGANALQAMHTASVQEWDTRHKELIKATVDFRNECLEADTEQSKGMTELYQQIADGTRQDPAVAIIEASSEETRKITDKTSDEYHEAIKKSLMGRVPYAMLPTVVASTHTVMMMFRMAVWRLISDESVWPTRIRSAGFCKMAPIVRQSLAAIPALCGLVVPPRPAEAPAPPPSPVWSFLKQQGKVASSPQPSSGFGSGGSTPAGTPTGRRGPFGGMPPPLVPPISSVAPGHQPFPASGVSSSAAKASPRPGLFSTMAPLKLGPVMGVTPTTASAGLAVATPSTGADPGGRNSFALNPFGGLRAARSHPSGSTSKDDDSKVDADIAQLAQEVTRKRHFEGDGEGEEDDDGSDVEDMTVPQKRGKSSQQSPAKSGGKGESSTLAYTEEDINIVRTDRYAKDLPLLINYRNNEAPPASIDGVNLDGHGPYLDAVIKTGGITSRVVFEKADGKEYLKGQGVKSFSRYNDGWKTPLPRTTTGQFPDRANTAIEKVMLVYKRPNGAVVHDDDADGFGRTCLMGLWGLHSERALTRCTHNSTDGRYKLQSVNVCPLCKYWNTNDVSLNNHIRKHYNMGLCCPEDGFVSGSAELMRSHLREEHDYRMRSGKEKQADKVKQAAKKAAH